MHPISVKNINIQQTLFTAQPLLVKGLTLQDADLQLQEFCVYGSVHC